MPPRPARPLSTWSVLRTAARSTLEICDEQLFEELVVRRRYGLQPIVFVSDPEGIRHVLIDRFDDYPRVASIRRLFAAELGAGMFSTEGEEWRRHRRVASAAIDPRSVGKDVPALVAIAERSADELEERVGAAPFDISVVMARLAARLLAHSAAGGDPDGAALIEGLSNVPRRPRLIDLVTFPDWLAPLFVKPRPDGRDPEAERRLSALLSARAAADYGGSRDILWRFAQGLDRANERALSPSEARDGAAGLVGGGGVTRRPLTWLWYLLSLDGQVEAKLHAELDRVLGGGAYAPDALGGLTYTRQVVNETMRLYAPVPAILRQARRADTVCGTRVPRGGVVAVLPYVVHRHRRLWDDPDRFDPDRFSEARRAGRPRLAFLPFSAGPRVCVASAFATTQILVTVAALARRYRFRLAPGRPITPVGALSLFPDGGLWVTAEKR